MQHACSICVQYVLSLSSLCAVCAQSLCAVFVRSTRTVGGQSVLQYVAVRGTCAVRVQHVPSAGPVRAQYVCSVCVCCMCYACSMRAADARLVWSMHVVMYAVLHAVFPAVCMQCAMSIHEVCMQYACSMHQICMRYACGMHAVCVRNARVCMQSVCIMIQCLQCVCSEVMGHQ